MDGEQSLIDRIQRAIPSRSRRPMLSSSRLRLGIGDDAAVISPARGLDFVVTCDAFLENVHFLPEAHSPDSVGYKSLTRATSDLAAMGATPRFFLLSLALPVRRTGKWLEDFLAGMARAAREYRLLPIGGDTSCQPTVAISITVIGEIARGAALTRSGARPGDLIYVSGALGAAQLGLQLIRRGLHRQKRWKPLLRQHCFPAIRIALGRFLSSRHSLPRRSTSRTASPPISLASAHRAAWARGSGRIAFLLLLFLHCSVRAALTRLRLLCTAATITSSSSQFRAAWPRKFPRNTSACV